MSIHSSLIAAGFKFVGLCQVCNGRGWDYRLDGLQAKLKTDGNNNELVVTFDGLYNNTRVFGRVAIPSTIDQTLQEIGITTTANGN